MTACWLAWAHRVTWRVTVLLDEVNRSARPWKKATRRNGRRRRWVAGSHAVACRRDAWRRVAVSGVRVTVSWRHSTGPATRERVLWQCGAHRWRRSDCRPACTAARCSYVTKATTSARPSTVAAPGGDGNSSNFSQSSAPCPYQQRALGQRLPTGMTNHSCRRGRAVLRELAVSADMGGPASVYWTGRRHDGLVIERGAAWCAGGHALLVTGPMTHDWRCGRRISGMLWLRGAPAALTRTWSTTTGRILATVWLRSVETSWEPRAKMRTNWCTS